MTNRLVRTSLLSRREALAVLGAAGAAMLGHISRVYSASNAAPDIKAPHCVMTPKQTEGPYFIDERLRRSDIRVEPSDGGIRPGLPLTLSLRVSSIQNRRCVPFAGAVVDVWHCDATGVYSDTNDAGGAGKKFLRGYQISDEDGRVRFTTIYPGWYPGRAVHVHFKIRAESSSGKAHEFTSQLYFDDGLTDRIHAQQPYASKRGRRLKNHEDGIFRNGGSQLILAVVEQRQSYSADFDVNLQMT